VIVLMALGVSLTSGLKRLERRIAPWSHANRWCRRARAGPQAVASDGARLPIASCRFRVMRAKRRAAAQSAWNLLRPPRDALSPGLPIQEVLAAPRFALSTIPARNARAFQLGTLRRKDCQPFFFCPSASKNGPRPV